MTGPSGPTNANNVVSDKSSGVVQPELRYLAIGRIVRAHGIRGELSVAVLTDFPERFSSTEWVFVGNQTEADPYRLQKYRWHKKHVLLTLEGVSDRTHAEQLAGQLVQVPVEDAVPLPEGSYYLYQLVGLSVFTTTGERLGMLVDILETGANDVFVVQNEMQQEILLPSIPDVLKSVDLNQNRITVELIDGLI
ncbi:MAG: 16S rRNA processing protein RimM [Chloroflexi bacterium]|nr:MAG: 16S rRNA processing protein RimM [Chloroflexota bacterium]